MRIVLIIALLVAVCAGCNDTHVTRCNVQLASQIQRTNDLGAIVFCDPSYDSDEPATAQFIVQWNKPQPIVWLWEKRQNDYWLKVHAFMGIYEVVAWHDGRVKGYDAGVPDAINSEAFRWAVAQVG